MKIPLRYQMTEYDCGPTSLLNGLSYLFEREEIPPELLRNIMLFCLDKYDAGGGSGRAGTSHTAMQFLSHWLSGFGETGALAVTSSYLHGGDVTLAPGSFLRSALCRGAAAVARVDLEGWHYVLLTGAEGLVIESDEVSAGEATPEDSEGRIPGQTGEGDVDPLSADDTPAEEGGGAAAGLL